MNVSGELDRKCCSSQLASMMRSQMPQNSHKLTPGIWPEVSRSGCCNTPLMHTKYENNCFTGSWDMPNYVFFTFGDLVSKVKGQCQFWPHDMNASCDCIYWSTIEPLEWIQYWNNWHWTLSISWIWPHWITCGKIQNGRYLENEKYSIIKTIWQNALIMDLFDMDQSNLKFWCRI